MIRSPLRIAVVSILGLMLAASAGCLSATQPDEKEPQARQAQAGEKVKCRREYPTGSHIPRMVCHRVRQIDDRRDSDQQKMRNFQLGGAIVPPEPAQ